MTMGCIVKKVSPTCGVHFNIRRREKEFQNNDLADSTNRCVYAAGITQNAFWAYAI